MFRETDSETNAQVVIAIAELIRSTLPNWPEPRTSLETQFVIEIDGTDYYVTLTVQLGEKH